MAFDILCDFDGTITTRDVTDFLLERFAAPGWRDWEARWEGGEIGSRECMARQIELLRCSLAELETSLADVGIDPGFPTFLGLARSLGARLAVVSDGIDYAIRSILSNVGAGDVPVLANRLVREGERRFRLEHPHARTDCASVAGTCKCAAAARQRTGTPVIMIGDGRSDFCASSAVDLVFAKGALADHCEREKRPYLRFETFADLAAMLPGALIHLRGREAA
ncbi:MtnX-like HAD-IB family phosphatase [Aureimonas sp. AU4]|uniref:MtnX-like HAD-IB family phosphatase n=1 Tax=Aureimonas sp. AU4 TaxID=1638163 RepID=UPI000705E96A|nr:MtnX-like HAD-IB family phosphatase [Aureimonas sp. AU4]BAT30622.1 2,3-diketo-5-methylthio-1-phosphopentane phosphatase [Aureimonas sp. AU4]